jgi:hypothetical protein
MFTSVRISHRACRGVSVLQTFSKKRLNVTLRYHLAMLSAWTSCHYAFAAEASDKFQHNAIVFFTIKIFTIYRPQPWAATLALT